MSLPPRRPAALLVQIRSLKEDRQEQVVTPMSETTIYEPTEAILVVGSSCWQCRMMLKKSVYNLVDLGSFVFPVFSMCVLSKTPFSPNVFIRFFSVFFWGMANAELGSDSGVICPLVERMSETPDPV